MSKQQQLIDTALDLFYRHGVRAIGINEVLKASSVAKRTLYIHFESKEALVLAALQQRHEVFMQWLESQLNGAESNQALITQLFGALGQWFRGEATSLGDFRGCFFINTSAEFSDPDSPISEACRLHKREVKTLLRQHMPKVDEALLDTIVLIKEGAISTAYLMGDVDQVIATSLRALTSLTRGSCAK